MMVRTAVCMVFECESKRKVDALLCRVLNTDGKDVSLKVDGEPGLKFMDASIYRKLIDALVEKGFYIYTADDIKNNIERLMEDK